MQAGMVRKFCLGGAIFATAACQPTLDPVVPAGDAAYAAIALPATVSNPDQYLVRRGDKLSVLVFQEPDLSQGETEVDASGRIYLPLIGAVMAAGKNPEELAHSIEALYGARYLRNPRVTVRLDETVKREIAVEGEVELPGVYPVEPGYTLLSALALARSPTNTASLDEVLIFRNIDGRRTGARFDLIAIRSGSADDPLIYPGDVVVVGFSSLRGGYRDILQAAPLFNVFTQF